MKKRYLSISLLLFLIGSAIIIYPYGMQYFNKIKLENISKNYNIESLKVNDSITNDLYNKAKQYNDFLLQQYFPYEHTTSELDYYLEQLKLDNNNVISTIEIESIHLNLPIYHTCNDDVLQIGIGHLEYSTLPIGGSGTHCVLLGHTALSSSKQFSNLHQLDIGDIIVINTLGNILEYEVYQSVVIEPNDLSILKPIDNEDLLSLVTCTPYGIGSHRLIVTCKRINN